MKIFKSCANLLYRFSSSKINKKQKEQAPAKTEILAAARSKVTSKSDNPSQSQNDSLIGLAEKEKQQLIFQHQLQKHYQKLQSYSSDSYETVTDKFRRLKSKLNDRKVFIPNKPQYLAELDKSMKLIKQKHKVWRSPTIYPQRMLGQTKGQIIQWELEQAKKRYYLSLIENQKFLIGAAFVTILMFSYFEYSNFIFDKPRPKIPKPNL